MSQTSLVKQVSENVPSVPDIQKQQNQTKGRKMNSIGSFRRNKTPAAQFECAASYCGRKRDILAVEELYNMKQHASLKKGMRMNKNRFAKRVAVAAGFFFLGTAPGLTRAQSSPPSPVQTPHNASPVVRPRRNTSPTDDFAGLKFSDDQKVKIDQIHQDMKFRMDTVVKDQGLSAEQKDAMLEGYRRMERGQVFKVLTPEQQIEVRKKVGARRAAEQEEKKKKQPLPN